MNNSADNLHPNSADTDSRNQILLSMHRFYTEEARHQRTMMWETCKWFAGILTALHVGWFSLYVKFGQCHSELYIALILLAIFGMLLAIMAKCMLQMFYQSNLEYITMLAKTEEELYFDIRKIGERKFFRKDKCITYYKHIENRRKYATDKDMVNKEKHKGELFKSMRCVFYLFAVGSVAEFTLIFLHCVFKNLPPGG